MPVTVWLSPHFLAWELAVLCLWCLLLFFILHRFCSASRCSLVCITLGHSALLVWHLGSCCWLVFGIESSVLRSWIHWFRRICTYFLQFFEYCIGFLSSVCFAVVIAACSFIGFVFGWFCRHIESIFFFGSSAGLFVCDLSLPSISSCSEVCFSDYDFIDLLVPSHDWRVSGH